MAVSRPSPAPFMEALKPLKPISIWMEGTSAGAGLCQACSNPRRWEAARLICDT